MTDQILIAKAMAATGVIIGLGIALTLRQIGEIIQTKRLLKESFSVNEIKTYLYIKEKITR